MSTFSIPLFTEAQVALLYSYPNAANSTASLGGTVLHWFNLTLQRDGLADAGVSATVRIDSRANYFLELEGPPEAAVHFPVYKERLTKFLSIGLKALTQTIPIVRADGRWDPQGTGRWRFFLPLGVPMVKQRSLQFFHYPPIRLLDTMQDYLNDPVPVRWEELLQANGVPSLKEAQLFETIIHATPIAATDDQGSTPVPAFRFPLGLIPIEYFSVYQKAQVAVLLNAAPGDDRYTIPIVVYGSHPRQVFGKMYGVNLDVNVAATAEIIAGKKTAVLGASHPYRFYATAQGFVTVGSGEITGTWDETRTCMIHDLIAARWQATMANTPAADPEAVLEDSKAYWNDATRAPEIAALMLHQGSLYYPDPNSLQFTFKLTLQQAVAAAGSGGPATAAAAATSAASVGPRS